MKGPGKNAAWLLAAVAALSLPAAHAQSAPDASRGDLRLTYTLAETGETMGYRLYVPSAYEGSKAAPLVVVLHGAGGDENSALRGGELQQMAEKRGYLVLAVRGYAPFGAYGNCYPVVVTKQTAAAGADFAQRAATGMSPPAAPPPEGAPVAAHAVAVDDYAEQAAAELTSPKVNALSELEVMAALADVESHYKVDPRRIYLMGNSMGGVGTMYLAARYPKEWAAISPQGGPIAAWSYPFGSLKENHVAVLFVHGEYDGHSNPHWSQVLTDTARRQGVEAKLVIVPHGSHGGAWLEALPQIFNFFDDHRRREQ